VRRGYGGLLHCITLITWHVAVAWHHMQTPDVKSTMTAHVYY
jgi:hypothetical protein